MKLRYVLAADAAAATAFLAVPAAAGFQDFELINSTGYDIREVYVSPIDSRRWEEDLLGSSILPSGDSLGISFDWAEDQCYWDIMVIYTDDEEALWEGIDLCETSVVEIEYDHRTGRTWATTG